MGWVFYFQIVNAVNDYLIVCVRSTVTVLSILILIGLLCFGRSRVWLKEMWPYVLLGFLALLHTLALVRIDSYAVFLVLLAILPALFPLIVKYVDHFKLGDNLIKFRQGAVSVKTKPQKAKTRINSEPKIQAMAPPAVLPEDLKVPESEQMQATKSAENSLDHVFAHSNSKNEIPIERLRLLGTMWHYQRKYYGSESQTRWAMAPDDDNYLAKMTLGLLWQSGKVERGANGLYFLTDEGIKECQSLDPMLTEAGPFYTKFQNALEK